MMSICHVFDSSLRWSEQTGLEQLLDRLPTKTYQQHAMLLGKPPGSPTLKELVAKADRISPILNHPIVMAPYLSSTLRNRQINLFHTWGISAIAPVFYAVSANRSSHIVASIYNPRFEPKQLRMLRTMAESRLVTFACTSGIVQRRLIEGGISPERSVVIRPGVDFGLINASKKSALRSSLGILPGETAVVLPSFLNPGQSALEATFAMALRNYVFPGWKVLIPNDIPSRNIVVRFARWLPTKSDIVIRVPDDLSNQKAIAVADLMVVTEHNDFDTTSLAWAMASGVGIVASATPSVSELIAHKVNGLLCKPYVNRWNAMNLGRLLGESASQTRLRETASGQAYEVFSIRRYTEQVARLYENILAGRPAQDGISDAAVAA